MSLEKKDVTKIARLARVGVNKQDLDAYAHDLSGILGLIEQMNTVDTSHIMPMAHPLDQTQRLRADEVNESNQRELFQSQAPQLEAGLYLVPKVIE